MSRKRWVGAVVMIALMAVGATAAAQPAIVSAWYDEHANILGIEFDTAVLGGQRDVLVAGMLLDDDAGGPLPDYALRGGTMVSRGDGEEAIVKIRPIFGGIIDSYTYTDDEGNEIARKCWGNDYADVKQIETALNHENLRLYIPEGAIKAADGSSFPGGWTDVEYRPTADGDKVQLQEAYYDAKTNVLRFVFNRTMQYDQVAEDVAERDPDTRILGPGNGTLDVADGEDRNENGVLDMEQDVVITNITFKDGEGGTFSPNSALDMTRMDSTAISLQPSRQNRFSLEALDLSSLTVSFSTYTFLDVDYNPAVPVSDFPVTVTLDDDPPVADSAAYDFGKNQLFVWFNQPLDSDINDYIILPKFSVLATFGEYTATIPLAGGAPGLVDGNTGVRVTLLVADAHTLEDSLDYYRELGADFTTHVGVNAVLNDAGNGNIPGTVSLSFVEESSSRKAPEPVSAAYDAYTNVLSVEFDVRLDAEVDPTGFSFVTTADTLTLSGGTVVRSGGNKVIEITLEPEDQVAVESNPGKDSYTLSIAPYSVLQQRELNGNRKIEGLAVTYSADLNPPLPNYVWYDANDGLLIVGANMALGTSMVDLGKLTYSGVSLAAGEGDITVENGRLVIPLADAAVSALAELSDEAKVHPIIDLAAGFITSPDDLASEEFLEVGDKDSLTNDVEGAEMLVGYGRNFYIESYEAFPTVARIVHASIRAISDHAVWYVANDQWTPYEDNQDLTPLKPAELDSAIAYWEQKTPKDADRGVYDQVVDVFAGEEASKIPERVDILFADIYDEYSLGRNDSNASFWKHGYFDPADLPSPTHSDISNQAELIIIDSHPQSFMPGEVAYTWDEDNEEWDLADTSKVNHGLPALANVFTEYVTYKVDPFEDDWVRKGMAYLSEFIVDSPPAFYGGGEAKGFGGNNSLTFIGSDLKSRADYVHAYMFFLYLYEKYGGVDMIREIAESPRKGIDGVNKSIIARRDQFDEWLRDKTLLDIYTDFATANLIDTTYGDDHRLYAFTNIIGQRGVSGTAWKWKASPPKDSPPYNGTCPDWGFNYYFSGYDPFNPNPVLDPVNDYLNIFAGENSTNIKFRKVNIRAVNTAGNLGDQYTIQEFELDPETRKGSVPMSPGDGWTFGPDYADSTDFPTWILIAVGGGDFLATNDDGSAEYNDIYVVPNPVFARKMEVYLLSEKPLYNKAGEPIPYVYATVGSETGETALAFSSEENFEVTQVSNELSKYTQYLCGGWLGEQGTYYWHVEAYFDNGGEATFSTRVVGTSRFEGGTGGDLALGEKLRLHVPATAVRQNTWASAVQLPMSEAAQEDVLKAALPANGERQAVSPAYRLAPVDLEFDDPAMLTIQYDIDAVAGRELGVYYLLDGRWVYVGGTADPENGVIHVPVARMGTYQVQAGPKGETVAGLLVPQEYALGQNYPNPFNPSTTIAFQTPHSGRVSLIVYDLLGREVARLLDGHLRFGRHQVTWNGLSEQGIPAGSGVYFVRMQADGWNATKKMVLVK